MRPKNHTGPAAAAGAVVACLIGAGFASGQEVLQFFTAYGPVRGLCGAALACALLGGAAAAMLSDAGQGGGFTRWCGPRLGRLLGWASPAVLFGVYTVMLAGAGALLQSGFGLPAAAGRAGMCAAVLVTVLAGLGRMTDILGRAGPLIAAFVAAAGVGALLRGPTGQPLPALPAPPARSWWAAALVYAGYNLYLLAPFLQALAGRLPGQKPARRAAWLGCGIFGAALALLHLAFCLAPESLADPAPTVALVRGLWPWAAAAAVPVLLAGVYTTAAPLLFGICGALPGRLARSRTAVLAVGLAGLAGSALPFGRLVGALYPAIGWLGLILAAGVLLRRLPPKASPARRRRRGALPPCLAGILQNPAGPYSASVGDDACIVPQTLRCRKPHAAGENARPTKPLQAGSNTKSGSPLPGPAGGPMQASAPTQRAPGGKDSLCDRCEPSGHPIPICGSGSESERNVLAHRSARCRRCALRRRLAIGSLGAGKPAVQSFIACLCRHTTEDRPSLIAPGFVSFADNGGLFRCFWVAPKAAAHGGCRYESNQPTPPGFFMTIQHPPQTTSVNKVTAGQNPRPATPL